MNAGEQLRILIGCVRDLKQSQGTQAFSQVLRRLYKTADMAVPFTMSKHQVDIGIEALLDREAGQVTVAVTPHQAIASHPERGEEPPASYIERRLREIEEAAAETTGVSVEEIRCAGL